LLQLLIDFENSFITDSAENLY